MVCLPRLGRLFWLNDWVNEPIARSHSGVFRAQRGSSACGQLRLSRIFWNGSSVRTGSLITLGTTDVPPMVLIVFAPFHGSNCHGHRKDFFQWGAKMFEFHSAHSKLKKATCIAKNLIGKCQISKSKGKPPSKAHGNFPNYTVGQAGRATGAAYFVESRVPL